MHALIHCIPREAPRLEASEGADCVILGVRGKRLLYSSFVCTCVATKLVPLNLRGQVQCGYVICDGGGSGVNVQMQR
jgi:hypothetical protein